MSAGSHTADSGPSAGNTSHETPGVDMRLTLFSAAGIVATVIVGCIISGAIYGVKLRPASERSPTPLDGKGLSPPAGPRLEGIELMSGPREDAVPAAAADRLKTYGWVDRQEGIVRIPIQRAIELAIERHWLPTTKTGKTNAKAATPDASKKPPEKQSSP